MSCKKKKKNWRRKKHVTIIMADDTRRCYYVKKSFTLYFLLKNASMYVGSSLLHITGMLNPIYYNFLSEIISVKYVFPFLLIYLSALFRVQLIIYRLLLPAMTAHVTDRLLSTARRREDHAARDFWRAWLMSLCRWRWRYYCY